MKTYKRKVESCRNCSNSYKRGSIYKCLYTMHQIDTPDRFLPECPLGDWQEQTDKEERPMKRGYKKYTINAATENGFEQMVVEGKQVHLEGFEDVHLFYRPDAEQKDYILSEKETGLMVVRSYTVRGLKSALQKRDITQDRIIRAVKKQKQWLKKKGLLITEESK